eukprot:1187893-Prorocentrum_minimum.AAC.2
MDPPPASVNPPPVSMSPPPASMSPPPVSMNPPPVSMTSRGQCVSSSWTREYLTELLGWFCKQPFSRV